MILNFVLFFAHKITILDLQFHDKKWHSIKNFSTCVDMCKIKQYTAQGQVASVRGAFCCAGAVCLRELPAVGCFAAGGILLRRGSLLRFGGHSTAQGQFASLRSQ
jgi:hypothetical protein